jgi:signal transduction histidine kinase
MPAPDGQRQRQLAAIARAASSVADAASLEVTLNTVAQAVFESTALAAVQILVFSGSKRDLQVVGTAGFTGAPAFDDTTGFTARLAECRELGARLRMLDAVDRRCPVVVRHRKAAVMADPAWAPMHQLVGGPDWDSFVSVPLVARDRCVGVLNAFFSPGEDLHEEAVAFLSAIADQAAMAVDYTALLARSALDARREERRRITRDLHDSVVQQVFSLRMRASALVVELDRDSQARRDGVGHDRLRSTAVELAELSKNALVDLRELMFELRPGPLSGGLLEAVRAHAARLEQDTGLAITVEAGDDVPELPPDLQHDLYRVVQEALHNTVKHADAHAVEITLQVPDPRRDTLVLEIRDDGSGGHGGRGGRDHAEGRPTLGLVSMRERAQRWGGGLEVGTTDTGGWLVRVTVGGRSRRCPGADES